METGSRQVRMTFPNSNRTLLPGQFVNVKFKGDAKPNAVLIPQRSVQQGPQGPFVYVVNQDEKIELRHVEASAWQGDQWLIDSGLQSGERVVVNGLMKIGPGAPVKAVPVGSAPPPADTPAPPAEPKQG